ncbi:MAG TPA: FtsW/RodA/SpoVE family cell cycle protein [Acidimicrobiales bacterium]|nr:FtsW/RodA/SpoVE family cell cycle protein [Acidimicrobiales bacterium]
MAQQVLDPRTSERRRLLEHVDVMLLLSSVAVALLGVVMVYSATQAKQHILGVDPRYYLKRQAVFLVLGLVAMTVTAVVDYHKVEELGALAYAGVIGGLALVMSPAGSVARGSQRWFQVGSFQLQPSAFAGAALIVVVASVCCRARGGLHIRRLGGALALAGLPIGLLVLQPDLGTALVLGVILLTMLFVAGASAKHLAVLALLAACGVFAVVHLGMLKHYQVERLTAFYDQQHTSQQAIYNLKQSETAIGAGGPFGRGLFHGSQTNLAYVPEQHTDFIFTAVGEQLGFLGGATLLALFGLIVWRVWRTSQLSRDALGALLCAGVLGMITVSVFENAGMTMGILPITGIPLPLMSYGGSAVIATFAALGLVLNVGMRRFG